MDEHEIEDISHLRLGGKLANNKKKVAAFCALLIFACVASGCAIIFMGGVLSVVLQLTIFLALGFMHVAIIRGNLSLLTNKEKTQYTLILSAAIFIGQSIFYLIADYYNLLLIVANSCIFLFVYATGEVWRAYSNISNGQVPLWYYSGTLAQNRATLFLNSIPVKVKVQTEQYGREEQVISFRAPVKMKLGLIFYHMVQEQKEKVKTPVEFKDADDKPYGWVFFTVGLAGWSKFLNPEADLVENGIRQNAVIIARRVTEQALLEAQAPQPKLLNITV